MISPKSLVFGLLAASAAALPTDLIRRDVIGHDEVVGFAEAVPEGTAGTLMLKYKPFLKVFNGCVPFPAVDAAGNTGCAFPSPIANSYILHTCVLTFSQRRSPDFRRLQWRLLQLPRPGVRPRQQGQRYLRHHVQLVHAQGQSGDGPRSPPRLGERRCVAVRGVGECDDPRRGHLRTWKIREDDLAVAGWYVPNTLPPKRPLPSSFVSRESWIADPAAGTRPKIGYISYFPVNHQLISTTDKGGEQPLIAWESMTAAARTAIENTNFGKATPTFRDSEFQKSLDEAVI